MINDELIKEIKDKANIVDVISNFIKLNKAGKDYLGICPFHDDTSPSLRVSPELKLFKCFACNTAGDVFRFVQLYLKINYFEAVRKVAELIGFNDPRLTSTTKSNTEKSYDNQSKEILACLHDTEVFYQYNLGTENGQKCQNYLAKRNIEPEFIESLKIGYSPADGESTINFLKAKGHSLKTIEDAGISKLQNGNYVDRFAGRLVFPISNSNGETVGFSARILEKSETEPKYINSPGTKVYIKGDILYNYYNAKDVSRLKGNIYVVEGFMDVIALQKAGLKNVVATMGTKLTENHIRLLKILNCEVILCLDGDARGQEAMMKIAHQLTSSNVNCSIIDNRLSPKDPDEIINSEGKDSLIEYLNKKLNFLDFSINFYTNTAELKNSESKRKLIEYFAPILNGITDILEFNSYIRKIANLTSYDFETISSFVKSLKKSNNIGINTQNYSNNGFRPERKSLRKLMFAEKELLFQMVKNSDAIEFYKKSNLKFYDEIYSAIASVLVDLSKNGVQIDPSDIINNIENSNIENKQEIINELASIAYDSTRPVIAEQSYLKDLLNSILGERERIVKEDILNESLSGKSDIEKARILEDRNREKEKDYINEMNGDVNYGKKGY